MEKYEKLNWRIIRCGSSRKMYGVQNCGRERGAAAHAPPPTPLLPAALPAPCSKPGGATVKPDDFYTLYG